MRRKRTPARGVPTGAVVVGICGGWGTTKAEAIPCGDKTITKLYVRAEKREGM